MCLEDISLERRKIEKEIAERDGLDFPAAGVPHISAIENELGFNITDLGDVRRYSILGKSGGRRKLPKHPDGDGRSFELDEDS